MGRGYTVAQFRDLVDRIRAAMPGVGLATDVIVGFPGETEAQFEATYRLLEELRFDMVHVAAYSPRPGTPAERLPDDVPPEEKERRRKAVDDLQERIVGEINAALLGQTVEVLVEERHKGKWRGRTRTNKLVFFDVGDRDWTGQAGPGAHHHRRGRGPCRGRCLQRRGDEMKRLIINADDLGYDEGVVPGHHRSARGRAGHQHLVHDQHAGLAPGRRLPARASRVSARASTWSLTTGAPCCPPAQVPALVDADGQFLDDGQILRSLRPGTTAQLRAEFRAQIERFIADVGRPPDHLDNHCAVSYVRPDRFKVTLELAQEYGLPIRAPFGDDLEEQVAAAGPPQRPAGLAGPLAGDAATATGWTGPASGGPTPSSSTFPCPATAPPEYLLSVLDGLRDGWISELLAHPGYDGDWREEDLRALLDPRVGQRLEQD